MNVPDYFIVNKTRIQNQSVQDLGKWSINYNSSEFYRFNVVQQLNKEFPDQKIFRSDVVRLFKEDQIYLAFIAAMVWGGINASRPRAGTEGKEYTNFYGALSCDQELILNAISSAKKYFINDDLATPFKDMRINGKYKISGIDYSYFTKIFFFLGQSDDQIKVKPLIFDKWTKNAFFALLSQSDPDCIPNYFISLKKNQNNDKPGEVVVKYRKLSETYDFYVRCMNHWAVELGVTPDMLEQFVFGKDLRVDKSASNPRNELWKIALLSERTLRFHG
jgi:hypothetical protein